MLSGAYVFKIIFYSIQSMFIIINHIMIHINDLKQVLLHKAVMKHIISQYLDTKLSTMNVQVNIDMYGHINRSIL